MKKILSIILVGLFVAACSEKNTEYYFENLDKAETKIRTCEADLEKAFKAKSESGVDNVLNDPECKAADEALKKKRQLDREKERVERERLQKLEVQRKQKELEDATQALRTQFVDNRWEDNLTEFLKTECVRTYSWGNKNTECQAWGAFYDEEAAKGKAELLLLSYEDLGNKEAEFCTKDKRAMSPCTVWETAYAEKAADEVKDLDLFALEKEKERFCPKGSSHNRGECRAWKADWNIKSEALVQLFLNDYDLFKSSFNTCAAEAQKIEQSDLRSNERYPLLDELRNMSPCVQAKEAHSKRGLGYNNLKILIP